jgi:hypothetical protein
MKKRREKKLSPRQQALAEEFYDLIMAQRDDAIRSGIDPNDPLKPTPEELKRQLTPTDAEESDDEEGDEESATDEEESDDEVDDKPLTPEQAAAEEKSRAESRDAERRLREAADKVAALSPGLDINLLREIEEICNGEGLQYIDPWRDIVKEFRDVRSIRRHIRYTPETVALQDAINGAVTSTRRNPAKMPEKGSKEFLYHCLLYAHAVGFWWGRLYYSPDLLAATREMSKFAGPY